METYPRTVDVNIENVRLNLGHSGSVIYDLNIDGQSNRRDDPCLFIHEKQSTWIDEFKRTPKRYVETIWITTKASSESPSCFATKVRDREKHNKDQDSHGQTIPSKRLSGPQILDLYLYHEYQGRQEASHLTWERY